jgi:hypothetical protein
MKRGGARGAGGGGEELTLMKFGRYRKNQKKSELFTAPVKQRD